MKPYFRLILMVIAMLLAGVAPASAQTGTVVRVYPAFQQVQPGAEFDLTIQVDDVVNLYAYDLTLSFPPDKVEVMSASAGSFLEGPFLVSSVTWNNEAGTVWAIIAQQNPAEPQSGSGTLVTVHLRAKAAANGDVVLVLSEVTLSDRDGFAIPCSLQNGRVKFGAYQLWLPLVLR
jgi:hypothetical protein